MKKLLAFMLVFVLALSLFACGKSGQTDNQTTTATQTTTTTQATTTVNGDFEKPADYAAVMLIKINPQFGLYLDADGKVLALEAMNDDAKSIQSGLSVTGKAFEVAVEEIIIVAHTGGFIKDGGAVTLEITEANNVDATSILNKASAAANKTSTDLKIQFSVNAQDKTGNQGGETTTTTTAQQTTTVAPTTTTTTKPAPSVINPKTNLQQGIEYIGNFREVEGGLRAGALQFDGEYVVLVERFFTSEKPEDEGAPPITFNGKIYYSEGGGMDPHCYELTDTEILITSLSFSESSDDVKIKAVLQSDGMIKIIQSADRTLFPVGAVYSTNIAEVLR